MSEKFPGDVTVSVDDLRRCGWQSALRSIEREGYPSMWQGLSAAARQAITDGRLAEGKVLWLLADACSLRLVPNGLNEPFKAVFLLDGKRSALPEDFDAAAIDLFAQAAAEIDDTWLRARLADLVWLVQEPRQPQFALMAIDAYRSLPLELDTWLRGGEECWIRAVRLAKLLGASVADRLDDMEANLVAAVEHSSSDGGFLSLWIADLLFEMGLAQTSLATLALKLQTLAQDFDAVGDHLRSRGYREAAARRYERLGEDGQAAAMTASVAESWVKEAAARVSSENPSHLAAQHFIENAIHVYRRIPRKQRGVLRVDQRITELRAQLADAGSRSLDEMAQITTPGIDIGDWVVQSRQRVSSKSLTDALASFADISNGIRADQLREQTLSLSRQFLFQSLFGTTVFSRDGRVIAKRPPMGLEAEVSPETERAILADMVKHHSLHASLAVQGGIWPALETLLLEHRVIERDLIHVARDSPVVPPGRVGIIAKGLFAGFELDFLTAIHLLVPQVEHLVRWHLKARGATTTSIDADGIENEIGLGSLLERPEVGAIFGKDLAFELSAMFVDPFGPNLRNEVAHGLLEEDAGRSVSAVYAWWLCFRLVFKSARRRLSEASRSPSPTDQGAGSPGAAAQS